MFRKYINPSFIRNNLISYVYTNTRARVCDDFRCSGQPEILLARLLVAI